MKFPLSWLKEFISPLPEPQKIKEVLTDLGLEVEALQPLGDDWIFEVALTPNLNHGASLLGVARELKAALDGTLSLPKIVLKEEKEASVEDQISVEVKESDLCPRYSCRFLYDVKVMPSPQWVKERLEQSGMRSVNNVVDATNLVLLEMGQPLHAFDYDTISGKKIIVRKAHKGEMIETIDHENRSLTEDILVIADEKKPIAIAGIMGALHSEVTENTTRVILESAYFEPTSIRRASKRLDLHSESSRRFERGADFQATQMALDRAAALIQELGGGKVAKGFCEVKKTFTVRDVPCRTKKVNSILGLSLSASEIEALLTRLSFKMKKRDSDHIVVEVPSWRGDVKEEIDLVEEVARLYGYNHIYEKRRAAAFHSSTIQDHPLFAFERKIRRFLLGEGLTEFLSCDLIGEKIAKKVMSEALPNRSIVKVINPHSVEQSILRPSLLPNHLEIAKHNLDHGNDSIAAFEVGRIHFKEKEAFHEPMMVAISLLGKRAPYYFDAPSGEVDFFDLKGIIENLAAFLKIDDLSFAAAHLHAFHPGRQAKIRVGDQEIGMMGEIHPELIVEMGLTQPLYFAEISLEDLAKMAKLEIKMKKLPLFPGSQRDWTLTLKDEVEMATLFQIIREVASALLEKVTLLDIFRGEKVGAGWKNVTLRFLYREMDETVSQGKVDSEHHRLMEEVSKKLTNNIKQG